ncbi:MAG TPA: hypothetical protein VF294_01775, partial [Polyangiaceae bacterium]
MTPKAVPSCARRVIIKKNLLTISGASEVSVTERFWDAYFRSLKPLEVEEPIDVWVHRPPAYVLARILMPT